MVKTNVKIDPEDKEWLKVYAQRNQMTMTELIRLAIKRLRREQEENQAFEFLLDQTKGIWPHGDGLAFQKKIRDEWPGKIIRSVFGEFG